MTKQEFIERVESGQYENDFIPTWHILELLTQTLPSDYNKAFEQYMVSGYPDEVAISVYMDKDGKIAFEW